MHQLIASRFLDDYLVVRPGSTAGLKVPMRHFSELEKTTKAGELVSIGFGLSDGEVVEVHRPTVQSRRQGVPSREVEPTTLNSLENLRALLPGPEEVRGPLMAGQAAAATHHA